MGVCVEYRTELRWLSLKLEKVHVPDSRRAYRQRQAFREEGDQWTPLVFITLGVPLEDISHPFQTEELP